MSTRTSIRLISWNILAQKTIKRDQYPYASKICLKKKYRHPLLINQIIIRKPDIVVLQEVDEYEFLLSSLKLEGYFEQKENSSNGCAIFWNRKFKLITKFREKLIPFKHIWDHDNSFLMGVILEHNDSGDRFLVCTTHLYWRALADYAKLRGMVGCLQILKQYDSMPIVFAGDFNSCPDTAVYKLATDFITSDELWLSSIQIQELTDSYAEGLKRAILKSEIVDVSCLGDQSFNDLWFHLNYLLKNKQLLRLKSAYGQYMKNNAVELNPDRKGKNIYKNKCGKTVQDIKGREYENKKTINEPLYSNYCLGFKACIDYIFYHKIEIQNCLEIPSEPSLKSGLPNDDFPSDHVILGVDFTIN